MRGQGLAIGEVLQLPALAGAQLLAGAGGDDRLVQSVNVMEVPDILGWVRPGALLLTTAYPLREDPEALSHLVCGLHERELAGLAIKPGRYIYDVPTTMLRDADRLAFPVISLPPDASFSDIAHGVLTILLNRQAVMLERAAEIHDRFNNIVLTGGGFSRIAQALAESIDRPVAIVDSDATVRATTAGLVPLQVTEAARVVVPGERDDFEPHRRRIAVGDNVFVAQMIRSGSSTHGAILTLGEPDGLSEEALEALQYAATVSALRQVQARALAEEDRRFKTLCLEELVNERRGDRQALHERAATFGWDLNVSRTVLIAQLVPSSGTVVATTAIAGLAAAARASLPSNSIVWERSNEVAALVPVERSNIESARRVAVFFRDEAERRIPATEATIGVGTTALGPDELPRAFGEARQALSVGLANHGAGVHLFGDLGVERLLARSSNEELANYWSAIIGPIVDHDAAYKSDLLASLEQFLAVRNVAEAARRLFVHQNTLHKRLDRIESIIGPFQSHADRCLELALAIRIHRFHRADVA